MKNTLLSLFLMSLAFSFSQVNAQEAPKNRLGFLQLSEKDLPTGYQFTDRLKCQSSKVTALYRNIADYQSEFGESVHTSFQSVKGNNETGTILYFQFKDAKDFKAFLDSYLWGNEGKPSTAHPEEYAVFGRNLLVIWSTGLDSKIKKASQDMIERLK